MFRNNQNKLKHGGDFYISSSEDEESSQVRDISDESETDKDNQV